MHSKRMVLALSALFLLPLAASAHPVKKNHHVRQPAPVKASSAPAAWPHNAYEADPRSNPNCSFSTESAQWKCE